ncbi:hypothetical protein ECH74115_A0027 (plasmid) [Escherichia coli O157:H7 str. EC4115]|nr:hypothetical protein ECH74115_A0027 [Escherichia coli O157:H7 str. EC4115]
MSRCVKRKEAVLLPHRGRLGTLAANRVAASVGMLAMLLLVLFRRFQ